MKHRVTDEEAEEARARGVLLATARELRHMIKTPGWKRVYEILEARVPAVAIMGADDPNWSKDYTRGRLDEARFLLEEINQLLVVGQGLVEEQQTQEQVEREMRRVLGGGESVLA